MCLRSVPRPEENEEESTRINLTDSPQKIQQATIEWPADERGISVEKLRRERNEEKRQTRGEGAESRRFLAACVFEDIKRETKRAQLEK
jgi:hypothetical protein